MQKSGVVSLGEAMVDFIPIDKSNYIYEQYFGGAPANVAIGLSKLGEAVCFIGKVGNDNFGKFIEKEMQKSKVNISGLKLASKEIKTPITFVNHDYKGDRNFEFHFKAGESADQYLNENEINENLFKRGKVFHFGSISLIGKFSSKATLKSLEIAKREEMYISFDPNLRLSLWKNDKKARQKILSILPYVDILKVTEKELEWITNSNNINEGLEKFKKYNISLTFVTHGENGSSVFTSSYFLTSPSINTKTVDTTGSGDAFVSGMLYSLLKCKKALNELNKNDLYEVIKFANICGALTVSTRGAITSFPFLEDVESYLDK